ncbi:uncharacterized protein F5891DRAFT_1198332 [Suillus fuscotomentosus]|uniref:Uncharacterized protein n=1 Tax=Suillus fuscotomentosus TaxID=1912939 RepID=A0AAD4HD17_9AGAM|nr:uncharacterized protein F5891DRAFT_1198332 [Suillus fuscotomentosus]KAG1889807.1 hypothetical protein F5891DRAFT_1198332 [Suillus fuscotomentosus]
MHQAWKNDNSQRNPFESRFACCHTSTARKLQAGINVFLHTDISPSRLITSSIDLQDQQQRLKVDIANMSLQKHPPPHHYQHLRIWRTLTDATSKHHPAPTRHTDSPASSVHAQTMPVNAGVARMHMEDTRMKREGKEEEREEEGRILSVSHHPDSAPIFCNEDATPNMSHSRATTPPSPISTRSPSTSIVHTNTQRAPANLPAPPLLPVPTTYVRVTSAFTDVCWTYVLSTGSDTYGTHG